MNRFIKPFWLILLLVAVARPDGYGWNRATHMVTGAIAYAELQSTAPQTLARVVSLLRQHPDFGRWRDLLSNDQLSEEQRNEYLLMLAARWPDDVRGTAYDHPTWHYINYVYAPEQGIARTDTLLATGENILQAFAQNQQVVRSDAPDSTKAIALCWLFHLAGDVHMPLHTAALVDTQFPQGDRGGNLFKIKVQMSNPTTNLHAFWDGMLLDMDDYASTHDLALKLRQTVRRDGLPQLGKSAISDWSKESFQLAQDNAYRSNTLTASTGQDGTLLPPDYVATVKPIAGRQVALAGYRLADELVTDLP